MTKKLGQHPSVLPKKRMLFSKKKVDEIWLELIKYLIKKFFEGLCGREYDMPYSIYWLPYFGHVSRLKTLSLQFVLF